MKGLRALTPAILADLLRFEFSDNTHSPGFETPIGIHELAVKKTSYYVNQSKKYLVVVNPVCALREAGVVQTNLRTFNELIERLAILYSDYHLIIPLVGRGTIEEHVVTIYKKPASQNELMIFDSKASNPSTLLGRLNKGLFSRIYSMFYVVVRSLFAGSGSERIRGLPSIQNGEDNLLNNGCYESLGTQSILDTKTSGYHCFSTILSICDLLKNDREVTAANIIQMMHNPVRLVLNRARDKVRQDQNLSQKVFDTLDTGFAPLTKAWYKTFIKPEKITIQETGFLHYFIGFPVKGGLKRVLYFASLSCIFTPFINLLKIPTEFIATFIAEFILYFKDRLLFWSPVFAPIQYLRSALLLVVNLLHFACLSLRFMIRALTSPIRNFHEAFDIHPFFGAFSLLCSFAGYTSIAIWIFPLVIVGINSAALTAFVNFIGGTIAVTLSTSAIALSAGSVTGLLLIAGLGVFRGFKSILNMALSYKEGLNQSTQETSINFESEQEWSSEDDFDYYLPIHANNDLSPDPFERLSPQPLPVIATEPVQGCIKRSNSIPIMENISHYIS